jgi:hypothetical protein
MPIQNPRNPFPAWRLPKGGVKSASDNALEKAAESCEFWAWFCGGLVVAGLVMEFALAALHPPYDNFWSRWGSSLTTALVAIGVFGEIQFGRMGYRREHELKLRSDERFAAANIMAEQAKKEAAEARERTAEIEKLTAWRHVNPEQRRQIADAIKERAPSFDVLIEFERADPEAFAYAYEIAKIFAESGVNEMRAAPNTYLSGPVFGLLIATAPDVDATVIMDAFAQARIPLTRCNKNLSEHLPPNNVAPNLYIFVGVKPPPNLLDMLEIREI